MEDLSIKAIFIGVSVFVTMTVFSAIILYFNTAKGAADIVSQRTDIAASYDSIMNEDNFEDYLTGIEVRSLINKYIGNSNVRIDIIKISGLNPEAYKVKGVDEIKIDYNNINNNHTWVITQNNAKIIKESKLDIINPVWNCKVEKEKNGDRTTLNISLDVEKSGEV